MSSTCKEIAIFKVKPENLDQVIKLSLQIFIEMNEQEQLLLDHQVYKNHEKDDEICWLLTWKSLSASKSISSNWPNYKHTKQLEALVDGKLYYGNFEKIDN